MTKPSRHEHERGAPLTADCDMWCAAKYETWVDVTQNLETENKALRERIKEADEVIKKLMPEFTGYAQSMHWQTYTESIKQARDYLTKWRRDEIN